MFSYLCNKHLYRVTAWCVRTVAASESRVLDLLAALNESNSHHLGLQQDTLRYLQRDVFLRRHVLWQKVQDADCFSVSVHLGLRKHTDFKLDAQPVYSHLLIAGTVHPLPESGTTPS